MPFRYSTRVPTGRIGRMLSGEEVRELAAELSVSDTTLYKWRGQVLIDAGQSPGPNSYKADRLAQARRRIKEHEEELKIGSTRLYEG